MCRIFRHLSITPKDPSAAAAQPPSSAVTLGLTDADQDLIRGSAARCAASLGLVRTSASKFRRSMTCRRKTILLNTASVSIVKILRDLDQVAARIAHVEARPAANRALVGKDLDARSSKMTFSIRNVGNQITNMTSADAIIYFFFDRQMKL